MQLILINNSIIIHFLSVFELLQILKKLVMFIFQTHLILLLIWELVPIGLYIVVSCINLVDRLVFFSYLRAKTSASLYYWASPSQKIPVFYWPSYSLTSTPQSSYLARYRPIFYYRAVSENLNNPDSYKDYRKFG